MKNTVKACTYLSMNYEFVSTKLSLDVLKNLLPLLDKFTGVDKINLIYSISNILKGDNSNKLFFFEHNGSTSFMQIIQETEEEKMLEMCTSSIKELASFKPSLRGML